MQITFPALRRFAATMLQQPMADPLVHRTVTLATHPLRGRLEAVRSIYEAGKGVTPLAVQDRVAGLARLRHRQRAAVFLTHVLKLETAEVATVLGIRPAQVDAITAAGMKRLNDMLGSYATRAMLGAMRAELQPPIESPVPELLSIETAPSGRRRRWFEGLRRAVAMGAAATLVVLSLTPAGASSLPFEQPVVVSSSVDVMPFPPLLMAR